MCIRDSPYVGFSPTTPQKDAGCLIEPPVSDPIAAKHSQEATEAALPPELPPGTLFTSHGFEVVPIRKFQSNFPSQIHLN